MSSDAEKTVQRMDEALLDNCRRQGLFKSGDRVIAACSGGADSMALLLFLLRHRRTLEIDVFPFWRDRAFCECELQSEDEPLPLPDWLHVYREVTDDPRYTNRALARSVPDEIL